MHDENLAKQAADWIEAVVGDAIFGGDYSSNSIHEKLKDGVTLCKLINVIKPGSVKKINE